MRRQHLGVLICLLKKNLIFFIFWNEWTHALSFSNNLVLLQQLNTDENSTSSMNGEQWSHFNVEHIIHKLNQKQIP